MKSPITAIFTALALAAASLVGAASQARAAEDINIGAILAMSGSSKMIGDWMSKGALLAAEEINAAGGINGRKVHIEIGDHKGGDVKAAMNELTRMMNLYKVKAVLSSYSAPTLAAQSIAVQSDIVLINGGAWSPKLINKKYLWNTRLTGDAIGSAILRVAYEDGPRKLGMIYRNESSGIDTAIATRKVWLELGGTVVAEERYDIAATNFSSQIAKLRSVRPDALFALGIAQDQGIIVKQARDLGYNGPIYGIDFQQNNIEVAGKAMEGYKFGIDEFDVNSEVPETAKYVKAFRAKYNEEPEFYGANYYEATYIYSIVIKALLDEGKAITGANLDAKIREMKSFPSVYGGTLTFNDNGTVKKPLAIFVVKDGKRVLIKRVQD